MKIYRDDVDRGRRRKRSRHKPIGLLLLGISLAVAGLATREARAQSNPQSQSELAALRATMKRVEVEYPRPPSVSATQVKGNGYWETLDLDVARYGVMRRFLPTVRSAHPALIAYYVQRTEDSAQWQFASRASKVISSVAALNPLAGLAGSLKAAADALVQEARQAQHIKYGVDSPQEQKAMLRALDLKGKRQALDQALRAFLAALGDLDPERNVAWKPLYQFLIEDAEEQWNGLRKDRDEKQRINSSLSMAYWGDRSSLNETMAQVEKLIAIEQRITSMETKLLENALAPGRMPMAFLEDDAREFIDARIEFDRELVRALDLPEVRAKRDLVKGLVGLFGVWESLLRREEFLITGRWILAVSVLTDVATKVLKAESWTKTDVDPNTGAQADSLAVQRAGQTIDQLNKIKEGWLRQGSPQGSLYVAVDVDEKGERIWTPYNWATWKWITASELEDLTIDGRVVEGLRRRWLLAAGSPVKSIRSLQDVRAADAREVFVAMGPAGAWTGVRKDPK